MTNTEYTALKAEIDLTTTSKGLEKLRRQIETRRIRSKERKLLRRIDRKRIPESPTDKDIRHMMDLIAKGLNVPRSYLGY